MGPYLLFEHQFKKVIVVWVQGSHGCIGLLEQSKASNYPTPRPALGSVRSLPPENIPAFTENKDCTTRCSYGLFVRLLFNIDMSGCERAMTGSARPLLALNSETGLNQRPSAGSPEGKCVACCDGHSLPLCQFETPMKYRKSLYKFIFGPKNVKF